MDYSSSIHDVDNPTGASPWGSSPATSPRRVRTVSFPATDDVPPLASPYNPTHQTSYSQDEAIGAGGYRPESSTGTGSVTESDGRRPDTAESTPSQQDQQHSLAGQQQQQSPSYEHSQQPHKPEPQRYHSAGRQAQHPPAPQYKLQAKVTGLERTGRKDPILRFDIHVCVSVPTPIFSNLI